MLACAQETVARPIIYYSSNSIAHYNSSVGVAIYRDKGTSKVSAKVRSANSVQSTLGPHLDLLELAESTLVLSSDARGRARVQSWDAHALAIVARAEARTVVVHDVGEREQLGPVDVLDAVYEDEDNREENECHPEHEIVEKRPICEADK